MRREDQLLFDFDAGTDILDDIVEISPQDIAIIGMSVNLPSADNMDEYWNNLKEAKDCIDDLPAGRKKDITDYLKFMGIFDDNVGFARGGYLNDIDKFDNEFFKITNNEAKLMDPNQRLFLESAWKAIEDAGYCGGRITGSNTGVFVGFTPRNEYRQYIENINPASIPYAETGNLSSIVASRISYILDLKGPSMIVNTECSSSLVALSLACRSLRNNEIDMAVVGGVRLAFCPTYTDNRLGIESLNEKVCAFDDDSDGAVFGEGSIAIILKKLNNARKDRDNIYAVIKGSQINQDGATVGITAPSVTAQEAVITGAWKDANINPETISYIETHGTGTSLGDPIEISGINRAFRKYTDRKQFCAVGSVKTNIGHLDNVSGLASLVKAVLALKNKQIPASINFKCPNRKINFETSAVYVNHQLSDWDTGEMPRRCGVSSFGLSGTNCHVILEEAPELIKPDKKRNIPYIFTLSSCREDGLVQTAGELADYLKAHGNMDIGDICYTENTGRGHYSCRAAVITVNCEQLIEALETIAARGLKKITRADVYYGEHHIISEDKKQPEENEIYGPTKKEYDREAEAAVLRLVREGNPPSKDFLEKICELYVKGADISWSGLYHNGDYYKLSLPAYHFEKKRCWLEIEKAYTGRNAVNSNSVRKEIMASPLLDRRAVESIKQDIFVTCFNVRKHWVLNEHKISGRYLAPGLVFLEMVKQCSMIIYQWEAIEFKNVVFMNSLFVEDGEEKEVQTIIEKQKEEFGFIIAGKSLKDNQGDNGWLVYCEGRARKAELKEAGNTDLNLLRAGFHEKIDYEGDPRFQKRQSDIRLGPRWTRLLQEVYRCDNEILASFRIPEAYAGDTALYYMHPSLLDMAINMISQNSSEDIYLPFSYGSYKVYARTEEELFSHIRRKDNGRSKETISCDIWLYNREGRMIGEINDFTAKRVGRSDRGPDGFGCKINYIECRDKKPDIIYRDEPVLLFADRNKKTDEIKNVLCTAGRKVIIVYQDTEYRKADDETYLVGRDEESYISLFGDLKDRNIIQIVHLMSLSGEENASSYEKLDYNLHRGVFSLFCIAKALLRYERKAATDLLVISDYVRYIREDQQTVKAHNNALFALGKVMENEASDIQCRFLDIDTSVSVKELVSRINSFADYRYLACRNRKWYIEEIGPSKLINENQANYTFCEKGVYIITGGMGGLGVRLAGHICSEKKLNIALIGRKKLQDGDMKLIQNIMDSGSRVGYYCADVSDYDKIAVILQKLRAEFGVINGIFHLAGIAGDGFIKRKTMESFRQVLLPKVYGTCLLYELTKEDKLDFFINYSSVSSIYGYPGQGDYAAANAYLDSFAAYGRVNHRKMLSINWAPWKDAGMAHDSGLRDDGVFKMIDIQTALSIVTYLLNSDLDNVIIGEINYRALSEYADKLKISLSRDIMDKLHQSGSVKADGNVRAETAANIQLKGKADNNYSKTEIALAKIWADTLGMNTVDIYKGFLEVGGDSIQAVGLLKSIEDKYPKAVTISDVFTYSSVSDMAGYIDGKIAGAAEADEKSAENKSRNIKDKSNPDGNDRFSYILNVLCRLERGQISVSEAEKAL
jgi:polyketide synthase PksN